MKTLSPMQVQDSRRTLIDVREYPEFAAGAIPKAILVPLSQITMQARKWQKERPLVTICKSGRRSADAAQKLEALGFTDVAVLEGGVEAWKQKGLPLEVLQRRPWSLERQVRIVAGSLVLGFSTLGLTASSRFFAGTMFVSAGLIFAGVTDICMMATILGKMPWNKPRRQEQSQSQGLSRVYPD